MRKNVFHFVYKKQIGPDDGGTGERFRRQTAAEETARERKEKRTKQVFD